MNECSPFLHYKKMDRFVVKTLQNVSETQASIPSSTNDLHVCWFRRRNCSVQFLFFAVGNNVAFPT